MDISAVPAMLGSLKTAAEIVKLIRESDVSLAQAETKLKLADLMLALADVRTEAAGIQQELLDKDAEIRRLTEELGRKASLTWERPFYWRIEGDMRDGPFCARCHDGSGGKLVRIHDNGEGSLHCLICNTYYSPKQASSNADVMARTAAYFADVK